MKKSVRISCLLAAAVLFVPSIASAENFTSLTKKGYVVGKMGQGKSGGQGWVLVNGDSKFFCKLKASIAYVDSKKMVSILGSGRMITLDRATYEQSVGGPDASIPRFADLKAGRVRPEDVGACVPLRG
ncbi:hypothetical protein NBH20_12610 [Rhizobium sp. S153]|uniref:DUF5666 domain-containing protein n=1 Tax=Ciceribacter sichuanensis TaxID=2949647 RepID=A0ABT0V816_9HYPH|nr:hypothetical protein [Ciceribacter sp. S153]MCM2402002.1 hypothetical protein [Ciceribacter sp. S153]